MSHLMSLSGVKRTCPFALHMSANDPKRTSGLLAKSRAQPPQLGRFGETFGFRCDECLLLRCEPVSPHPALSFVSATTLPTPARFRPLGPAMFDSPTIAS